MNFLSSLTTAEGLSRLCEVVAIVAGVLAVVALIGQTSTGRIVNRRQARELRRLDIERLRLEREVAPRRLTGNQKETLTKLLSGNPSSVLIISNIFDPESSDFADDFDSVIKAAGWETRRVKNYVGARYGVSFGTLEGSKHLAQTDRLSDALRAIGIRDAETTFPEKEKSMISPYFEKSYLYLVAGKKPPYQQKK